MSSLEKVLTMFGDIKAVGSRLKKEYILAHLLKDKKATTILKEILTYAYHPYWNYWVKAQERDTRPIEESGVARDSYWDLFKMLLDQLRNREVTGDAARFAVKNILDKIDSEFVEPWFNQILNRDIKIGFKLKSFEKQLGSLVPKCTPMLAAPWDGENPDREVAIEPKLDGLRCLAIFPLKGKPTAISRNGIPIFNTEKILEEFEGLEGAVLDGELIGSEKSWGSGISAAHTKRKKVDGLKFIVFDMLTIDEWELRKCKRTYYQRRSFLKDIIGEFKPHHTEIVSVQVGEKSAKKIKALGDSYIKQGLEGIIIKPLKGLYEFKRSKNWLKYKFMETVDLKVVGAIEGKHKNRHNLGALIVEGRVNGTKVRSEVGQGFSDIDRRWFWEHHKAKTLNGMIIELEHYGVTDALRLKKGDKIAALRNAVFLKVRDDKKER